MKGFLWLEKCFALRWLWTYKCIINVLWSTMGPSKCRSEQPSNHRRPISHWTSLWNSRAKHYNIGLPHGGGLEHYYSPSPPRPPTPAWPGCLSIAGVPQWWISCFYKCSHALPNLVSLKVPEKRLHEELSPSHTPHLSYFLFEFSTRSHPAGCKKRKLF